MKSSYETIETRRLAAARKSAKAAQATAEQVKERVEDPVTGLDAALSQAAQAIEIIQDPDGPVQQALGEATTARDEAQAAQADADQALSDAALAKTTADGKNRIFRGSWATTPPTPEGGFKQGDLWFKITSSGQVTNVNVWNGTAWVSNLIVADEILVPGSLGATSIKDGAITTPLIQAGAIVTEKLAAGAVTAAKLTIGDTTNLVDDPTFEFQSWSLTNSSVSYYEAQDGRAIRFANSSGATYARSGVFKGITAGDEFLVRAKTFNRAVGATLNIRVEWLDQTGALIANSANATTEGSATGTWGTQTVAVTAPAGAAAFRFLAGITASNIPGDNPLVLFREPQVLRRSNGELIVDGAITASKIAAGTITANEINSASIRTAVLTANAIKSQHIDAGAVTAEKIQAGAISTPKLTIGDFTNLIDDPGFQNVSESWSFGAGTTVVSTTGAPGNAARLDNAGGTYRTIYNKNIFAVAPGTKFLLSFRVQNSMSSAIRVGVRWNNENGATLNANSWRNVGNTGWIDVSQEITAPADAFSGVVVIQSTNATTGQAWVSKMSLVRMAVGEMIVDGAITASKIAANAITASKIAADAIDGKTITGAKFIGEATGKRVEIDGDSITFYGANNLPSGHLSPGEWIVGNIGAGSLQNTTSGTTSTTIDPGTSKTITVTTSNRAPRAFASTDQHTVLANAKTVSGGIQIYLHALETAFSSRLTVSVSYMTI